MNPPHFSSEESERIKEILVLYKKFKDLMLYADELKTESFIPAINEARDAFDHFMRSFAAKYDMVEDGEYTLENFNATFRHLYRGVYDLLDYIRIQQKDLVDHLLDDYSKETILAVLPKYYSEIRPDLLELVENIPKYKNSKDIGRPDIEKIDEYIVTVKKIKIHMQFIQSKELSLVEFEEKIRSEKIKNRYIGIVKTVIVIILSGVGGALITRFVPF